MLISKRCLFFPELQNLDNSTSTYSYMLLIAVEVLRKVVRKFKKKITILLCVVKIPNKLITIIGSGWSIWGF